MGARLTIDLISGKVFLFEPQFSSSGGTTGVTSGATYPEVNTVNELPAASANNGAIYVVRQSTGNYVLNRNEAGLYYSNGSVWRRLGDIPAFFNADNFAIYGQTGSTQVGGVNFDISQITGGSQTIQTLTVRDTGGTIALLADLDTKVDVTAFADYTGNTAPNTFLAISDFNTYSGATLALINTKIDDAPNDGEEYLRSNQSWKIRRISPDAQNVGFRAVAASGKTYSPGNVVQVTSFAATTGDSRYADWNRAVINDISEVIDYEIPTEQIAEGVSQGSNQFIPINPSGGYATKFEVFDFSTEIGVPVDWKIDHLQTFGVFNSQSKADQRWAIYTDNAGEPGVELYGVSDFDYSDFNNDGKNKHLAPAIGTLSITNGSTFWLVTLGSDQASVNAESSLRNDWAGGGDTNRAEYITVPVNVSSGLETTDSGTTWVTSTNNRIARVEIKLSRTTNVIPPTSTYGIVFDNIDDSTEGFVGLYGSYVGDTSGGVVGETWNDNDIIYVNITGGTLTNQPPADPANELIMAQIFTAAVSGGSASITALATATRGVYLKSSIYDPTNVQKDIFDLDNIQKGTIDGDRVNVDQGNLNIITGLDVQAAIESIDDEFQNLINNAQNVLQIKDISGGTEVNTVPQTPIVWTTQEFTGSSFNFSGGSRIYIQETGDYAVSYNLNYELQSGGRKIIGTGIRLTGSTLITPTTSASYVRNTSNLAGANAMPEYKVTLTNSQYIELVAYRLGGSGSVTTIPDGTWIKLKKII